METREERGWQGVQAALEIGHIGQCKEAVSDACTAMKERESGRQQQRGQRLYDWESARGKRLEGRQRYQIAAL